MFIFQAKQLFSQGSVLQFWGILVSYGEKSGILVSYYPPPPLAEPDSPFSLHSFWKHITLI